MKILVGMSGGLDSTFAAKLLIEEGHTVEGAVLKMHEYTECDEAVAAAESLGIPCHTVDCTKEFELIRDYFVNEYSRARTPNPCILCNREVKFKVLADYAKAHGFDRIATGHYADVVKVADGADTRYAIKMGKDKRKDQSYMLYGLGEDVLSILILPLASLEKSNIRIEAERANMPVANRKESLDICFLPNGDYASYIENRLGKTFPEGDFVDNDGNLLGRHKGIIRYTIGQRKGLGVALGDRAYVTDIDPEKNTVTLSKEGSLADKISVSEVIYSGMKPPKERVEKRLLVKYRYHSPLCEADCVFFSDGRAEVALSTPQRAVSRGQSCVFYDGDVVVAGGIID